MSGEPFYAALIPCPAKTTSTVNNGWSSASNRVPDTHIILLYLLISLFAKKNLQQADAVLAMYHDQGLPVLKYQGFGQAVNVTLGLPIIRTSVDHGTALDLAGTGQASTGSLHYAIHIARQMIQAKI